MLNLVVLPIKPEIHVEVDFLRGEGNFTASISGVPILRLRLEYTHSRGYGEIVVRGKIVRLRLRLNADENDSTSVASAMKIKYFPIIFVPKLTIFTRTGKADDALFTAALTTVAKASAGAVLGALSGFQGTETRQTSEAAFCQDVCLVVADGIIAASIADIIYEGAAWAAAKIRACRTARVKEGVKV